MKSYKKLLLANRAWSKEMNERRPGFLEHLAKDQKPEFLWIGCSDSRVPAEEITGTQPGQLFVHRNVANQANPEDSNAQSVIQYAVEALKVKHIIVCGHLNCGGVRAVAADMQVEGPLKLWLSRLKLTAKQHEAELSALDIETRVHKLVEYNVVQQVKDLNELSVVKKSVAATGFPLVHGWVFSLSDGLIHDIIDPEEDKI